MKPIPEHVIDHFAQFDPLPEDQDNVVNFIGHLLKHPYSGTPIPFEKEEYKDCYVAITPDGKWRVVYRPLNPTGIHVLSIDPEE